MELTQTILTPLKMENQFKTFKQFVKKSNLLFEDFSSVEFNPDYIICKMSYKCISVPFATRCPQLCEYYDFKNQIITYKNLEIRIKFSY